MSISMTDILITSMGEPSLKSEDMFHKQHYNTTTAEARTGGRDMNGRELQIPSKYAGINGRS